MERVVVDFLRERFSGDRIHVLQVDYENEVWSAEGGFVGKDCPMVLFNVKVDREGNILSNRVLCSMSEKKEPYG